MSKARKDHKPHVGLAIAVSGGMALCLVAGLEFLKVMDRLDDVFGGLLLRSGLSEPANSISPMLLWVAAGLLAFLLAAVMLNIAGTWRRLIVWGLTLVLTLFWGPVLILAAHKPEIGVVVVTVLWSGFCAMVYATNHVIPADQEEKNAKGKNHGAR